MEELKLHSLTPRVYWSEPDSVRDRPVMGAITGERGTLVVETGASPLHARQFLAALAEQGVAPPRFAVLTHWHWDHVFGTETMGLPTIGHVETRRRVQAMAQLDWRDRALDARVVAGQELAFIADHVKVELTNQERGALVITPPDVTFTDQMEVDLGDITVQVLHVGGDHSPDSSVVVCPQERVAFLGDCFYSGFIGDADFYTPRRLFPLLDVLEALPVDTYIMAHDPEPQTRAAFERDARHMRRTGSLVAELGDNRSALLERLPAALGEPLNEEHISNLDSFLRGLQPDVNPAV